MTTKRVVAGITSQDIAELVAAFYTRVRAHPVLGPVFEAKIGTTDHEWAPHLRKIEAFWANVMLGGRSYDGNPMRAHMNAPGVQPAHFAIWLDLFEAEARRLLPPEKSDAFNMLARRIGRSIKIGLTAARPDGAPNLF